MTFVRGSAWVWLALTALPLASCATRVTLPPLPDCHPASAAAPSAERVRSSGLLDRTAPVPAAEPDVPEEAEEGSEMERMEGHEHHAHPPPAPPPPPPGRGGR